MVNGILQDDEIKNDSREAIESDYDLIKGLIPEYIQKCAETVGIHKGGLAIAHCQTELEDPIRLFITREGRSYVSPVITREQYEVPSEEGCLSLAYEKPKYVTRFKKITVDYIKITEDEVIEVKGDVITKKLALIFQHEIDHFTNIYITNKL